MTRVLKIFCFVFLLHSVAIGQDIHFTQFGNSPVNLNPGNTGNFDGDVRFVLNHRSQWAAIPVPYKTYGFGVDAKNSYYATKYISSFGLQVNSDKAGDSHFSTKTFSVPLAKEYMFDSLNILSFGASPIIENRSFDVSALTFDSQYNGDVYDPNASSQENFSRTSLTRLDIAWGLVFTRTLSKRSAISAGYSSFNLLKPRASFFEDKEIKADLRHCFNFSSTFMLVPRVDVQPGILFSNQGKFKETVIQALGRYSLDPIGGYPTAVYLGGYMRLKDAVALAVGLDYYNVKTTISYDVNTSSLNVATGGKGAFELSVIYILKRSVPLIIKSKVCPIYM